MPVHSAGFMGMPCTETLCFNHKGHILARLQSCTQAVAHSDTTNSLSWVLFLANVKIS